MLIRDILLLNVFLQLITLLSSNIVISLFEYIFRSLFLGIYLPCIYLLDNKLDIYNKKSKNGILCWFILLTIGNYNYFDKRLYDETGILYSNLIIILILSSYLLKRKNKIIEEEIVEEIVEEVEDVDILSGVSDVDEIK